MRLRLPLARIVAVALFALLCAIVAGWALQLLAPRAPVAPSGAVAQAQPPADLGLASQLFGGAPVAGGEPAAAAAPSNIQVSGVLAAGERGVALLAIDGKPARPFAVGEPVSDGLAVRSVSASEVVLDRGGSPMRLPAPARSSVDVLTAGSQGGPGGSSSGSSAPPVRPLPPAGAAAAAAQPMPVPGAGGVPFQMAPPGGAPVHSAPPGAGPGGLPGAPAQGVVSPPSGAIAPVINARPQ